MLGLMTTTSYSFPCRVARDGNIYAIEALHVIFLTGNIFVGKLFLPFNGRKCHFPSSLRINSRFQFLILILKELLLEEEAKALLQ